MPIDFESKAVERWECAGLQCAIVPSPFGTLNGYVQAPEKAPDDYDDYDVEVHGGLTYGKGKDGWVGFDALHAGDCWPLEMIRKYAPKGRAAGPYDPCETERMYPDDWTTHWTIGRLRNEVNKLAEQLSRVYGVTP